jgi:hypothetical protein
MAAKVARNMKIVGAVPATRRTSSAVSGAFRQTDTRIASFKKASGTKQGRVSKAK